MDKAVKTSWKRKMEIKNEMKAVKQLEEQIKAAKQQVIEVFVSTVNQFIL